MSPESGIQLALVLLALSAIIPASFAYMRSHDFFDPRVIFTSSYSFMTGVTCLVAKVRGEYHPGLKVEHLSSALYVCAAATSFFAIGASLALRPFGRQVISTSHNEARFVWPSDRLLLCIVGILVVASLFWYTLCGLEILRFASERNLDKAASRLYASPYAVKLFYRSGAATLFLFLYFLSIDSFVNFGKIRCATLIIIIWYNTVCFILAERDSALVILAWLMYNRKIWTQRRKLVLLSIFAAMLIVVPILREAGARDPDSQRNSPAELVKQAGSFSSNLHVFTNVIDIVPARLPFRLGTTYLDSLYNLVPGLSEHLASGEPLLQWFWDNYDWQKESGWGFALDAEAYLNFGWPGPPLFFFLLGLLLGTLYGRAHRVGSGPFTVFFWSYATLTALFCIRADSRALIKLLVYGVAATYLLYLLSIFFAQNITRNRHRQSGAPR